MRLANAILGSFYGLMSFFWGVVWLNNVYLSWCKRIWRLEGEAASQTIGLFPRLDLFAIDHSTVATFVPFFGFTWLSWVSYKLFQRTKSNTTMPLKKEFPFFQGYNEWMVSLGLMGTVWGLIMIGYLPNLDNLKLTGLIGALRTALFSTLVALFWVYIIVLRIIRPGMLSLAKKMLKKPEAPFSVSSLQTSVETFAQNIEQLNSVLVASTKTIDDFRKKMTVKKWEEIENALSTIVETLREIKASGDEQRDRLNEVTPLLDELLATTRKNSACVEKISGSHAKLINEIKAIKEGLRKRDAVVERDRRRWTRIVDAVRKASEE
jgi:hypothetical protein